MQIKDGYEIKAVSDRFIVIPKLEANINFKGIITLNKTGKLLFEQLQVNTSKEALAKLLLEKFNVDKTRATSDVNNFIKVLETNELLVNAQS